MKKNYYTQEEIILCTYIARFGHALLTEKKISSLGKRSETSIIMKVQNIASMLKEKGFKADPSISPLTGKTTGDSGRETDWPIVSSLVELEKAELWAKCKEIFSK